MKQRTTETETTRTWLGLFLFVLWVGLLVWSINVAVYGKYDKATYLMLSSLFILYIFNEFIKA